MKVWHKSYVFCVSVTYVLVKGKKVKGDFFFSDASFDLENWNPLLWELFLLS